jgi:hypothetical protein
VGAKLYFLSQSGACMGAWNPWENPDYFWVVICKNAKVHREANLMSGHKIALGETDTFAPLPVTGPFVAVCVMNAARSFLTHPRKS